MSDLDGILIFPHISMDGDALGSSTALCLALRSLGKKAYVMVNEPVPKNLDFLELGCTTEDDSVLDDVQLSLMLDCNGLNRIPGREEAWARGRLKGCIDHHPTNSHYAAEEVILPDRSSCGEIVMKIILEWTGKLTKNEATLLYIALTTDTGAFQYANVNADSYRAAAALMDAGAEHSKVMLHFFRKTSMSRLRLEGMIYSGLHTARDGKVVIATVTRKMMEEAGATEDDCDDLAGLSGRAEGALINATIREMKDGSSRISLRSAPGISSSDVCAALGGGGHELAAGCTLQEGPEKAEELLLDVIDAVCGTLL